MKLLNTKDILINRSLPSLDCLPLEEKLVFSSGIWINPVSEEVPIRYLSYLLPLIACMQSYKNAVGQIYVADQAAIRLWVDGIVVNKNVDIIKNFSIGFISEMFPELLDKVIVSKEKIDCPLDVRMCREDIIEQLVDTLMKSNDSGILKFAENRANGDIKVPLRYMAEHSLYMRDKLFDDDRLFLIDNPDGFEESRVVMIGGPAEEIFYKTRKLLMNELGKQESQRNVQLFTDIGKLPPYYRKFMENTLRKEIEEDDVCVFLTKLNKQLEYDYLMLIIACSESPDYDIMKRRKSGFTKIDCQLLQNGFESLKIFLKQF